MKTISLSVVLFFLLLSTCNINDPYPYRDDAWIPDSVINLTDFNSIHNDYNSILPMYVRSWNLGFSTDKKSAGDNFDFVAYPFTVSFSWESGSLIIGEPDYVWGNDNNGLNQMQSLFSKALLKSSRIRPLTLRAFK